MAGRELKKLQALASQQQALIVMQKDRIAELEKSNSQLVDALTSLQEVVDRLGKQFSDLAAAVDEAGFEIVLEGQPVVVVDESDQSPSAGG